MQSQMQFRVQKRGYSLLIMLASPLLALSLGGVGWASICNPGCQDTSVSCTAGDGFSAFFEIDQDIGFNNSAGFSFDWGNSGANPSGCLTSANQTTPITCSCPTSACGGTGQPACCSSTTGGVFDGGQFINTTTPPKPPTLTSQAANDPTIPSGAASFGVDPLATDKTGICLSGTVVASGNCNADGDCGHHCSGTTTVSCTVNSDCAGLIPAGQTCVAGGAGSPPFTCLTCGTGDPTTFAGAGGEKNGDPINSETWGTSGKNPPKNEISNVYAIAHQIGGFDTTGCTSCSVGGDNCNSVNEIFAGFERVINNGDSHVDLEFLQSQVGILRTASRGCAGVWTGHRTKGDFLISIDYTTGGAVGSKAIHVWNCGSVNVPTNPHQICDPFPGHCSVTMSQTCATDNDCTSPACTSCQPNETCARAKGTPFYEEIIGPDLTPTNLPGLCSNNPQVRCHQMTAASDCSNPTAVCHPFTNAIKQAFNDSTRGPIGCGGWACRSDATNVSGMLTGTVDTNELYEVGVDLAGIGFSGCISTFVPHTRSSGSFTASTKDFAVIPFNTCAPTTQLTKTVCKGTGACTNGKCADGSDCSASIDIVTGDTVTYTYTEANDGNVPLTTPCPGATDKRSCFVTDDKCSTVTYQSGDTNNNNILDAGETWTFTCTLTNVTADTKNTARGHGIFNGKDVTYCGTAGMCGEAVPQTPPAGTTCDQDECAQNTVQVKTPSTTLTKNATASVTTTVNYTYDEKNDGQIDLNTPSVADDKCSNVVPVLMMDGVHNTGDVNLDGIFNKGETWHFKCSTSFNGAGPLTNVAVGHACFTSGGVVKDVTIDGAPLACSATARFTDKDETDTKTVTACDATVTGGK